jgi:hypothetical protein
MLQTGFKPAKPVFSGPRRKRHGINKIVRLKMDKKSKIIPRCRPGRRKVVYKTYKSSSETKAGLT